MDFFFNQKTFSSYLFFNQKSSREATKSIKFEEEEEEEEKEEEEGGETYKLYRIRTT
jgi:hypothetical protein